MKKSRYTDSQIISILKQNEAGISVKGKNRKGKIVKEVDQFKIIKR